MSLDMQYFCGEVVISYKSIGSGFFGCTRLSIGFCFSMLRKAEVFLLERKKKKLCRKIVFSKINLNSKVKFFSVKCLWLA